MYQLPERLPSEVGETAPARTTSGSYTIENVAEGVWRIYGSQDGVDLEATLEYWPQTDVYHWASSKPITMSGPRDGDWAFVLRRTL